MVAFSKHREFMIIVRPEIERFVLFIGREKRKISRL